MIYFSRLLTQTKSLILLLRRSQESRSQAGLAIGTMRFAYVSPWSIAWQEIWADPFIIKIIAALPLHNVQCPLIPTYQPFVLQTQAPLPNDCRLAAFLPHIPLSCREVFTASSLFTMFEEGGEPFFSLGKNLRSGRTMLWRCSDILIGALWRDNLVRCLMLLPVEPQH